jgi:signal transduction histidine kinase/Tfp pilus assembly protein PilF
VIRAAVRAVALALLLSLTFPAHAADAPFPRPLEAAFARAKGAMMAEPREALREVAAAEVLARNLPDARQRTIALATVRWLAGEAQLRNDAPEKAAPLLADGLRLIASVNIPTKLRGDLLLSRGALDMQREQAVDALVSFQEAYRIFGTVKEPRSQAIALQNIASLYQSANDSERAQNYYRQAAETYDGDPMLSLSLYNNRGNVLMVLERYGEAAADFQKALEIAQQLDKPLLEARVLSNLARTRVDLKQFDAADRTLARGFELATGSDADSLRRQLFATAARLADDRGDYRRAGAMIRECFKGLDLKTTTIAFRNAHLYAHDIFSKLGEDKLALEHLESLKRLTDESNKVSTTTGAALMAARFNDAAQKENIANLKADEARRTAEYQRNLFLSLGGATLVVIILLTIGLFTIRRSRNQVRDANVVLNTTNIALEKALKAKTEFLATTSHEIRTPLNGILGMTQVMLADPKLQPEMRDRIGIVHGAGVTMRSLVDDILDVAKMETGNLAIDAAPMDLRATLGEVTRIWEEQARAKGLGFRLELTHAPGWIESDAARLRQIIFNLLSNAIKFTERGTVTVRAVDEGEGEARRLKLTISDTGIGIPEEKFEEIFESFRQVDTSTTRQFGGTGLGLTICRNLARALGGDISVTSIAGEGSTFTIDLPLVPAEAPAEVVGEAKSGGTMLILDRNPIARSMLRTLFEPRVAQLCFAASAGEAIAMVESGGVTRVLIDEATLKAGEGDPFETLRGLSVVAQGIPVAILWLKPDAETQSQLLDAGVTQVIEKPIASAVLVEELIPRAKENSAGEGADPLVSQAA